MRHNRQPTKQINCNMSRPILMCLCVLLANILSFAGAAQSTLRQRRQLGGLLGGLLSGGGLGNQYGGYGDYDDFRYGGYGYGGINQGYGGFGDYGYGGGSREIFY